MAKYEVLESALPPQINHGKPFGHVLTVALQFVTLRAEDAFRFVKNEFGVLRLVVPNFSLGCAANFIGQSENNVNHAAICLPTLFVIRKIPVGCLYPLKIRTHQISGAVLIPGYL